MVIVCRGEGLLFPKTCSTFKAKQAQKKVFLRDFFVRSGNLENNHSAESLRVDVPAAPRRLGSVWTLAGSTIATFALLPRCGSDADGAGGFQGRAILQPVEGREEARRSGSAVKSPWDRVPEHGRVHRLGHRDAFLFDFTPVQM